MALILSSPAYRVVYSALVSEQKLETVPCPYCQGVILVGAQRCKYCLASLPAAGDPETSWKSAFKRPAVASLMSVVCPGLGQYYCGRSDKAVLFVFVYVVFVGLFYWLVFPWVVVAAWAGYDAYREASRSRN